MVNTGLSREASLSGVASVAGIARLTGTSRISWVLGFADGAVTLGTKQIKIADFISQTNHPVLTERLVELNTCHREVEHTGGAVFQLSRKVVLEGSIHTQQGREGLVDAHGRVAGVDVATHTINALISMVQVQTLQMLLYPGQFRQSAITHTPVGQQAGQRREDGQRLACTRGIGRQESRDKHLG